MSEISVIIVAGGSGTRMGAEVPKQFLMLAGKPVLAHTIERFRSALPDAKIIVALPQDQLETWGKMADEYGLAGMHQVCTGGGTRFQSVKNALGLVRGCDLVAVHDGVRPLVSKELIRRTVAAAEANGSAVPVLMPADSFRIVGPDGTSRPMDRALLRAVQTPQVFSYAAFKKAYETADDPRFTDDAAVMEAAGNVITLCEGDPANIKITTRFDMALAEALMAEKQNG